MCRSGDGIENCSKYDWHANTGRQLVTYASVARASQRSLGLLHRGAGVVRGIRSLGDHIVGASDAQAVFGYFKVAAKSGTTKYEQRDEGRYRVRSELRRAYGRLADDLMREILGNRYQ